MGGRQGAGWAERAHGDGEPGAHTGHGRLRARRAEQQPRGPRGGTRWQAAPPLGQWQAEPPCLQERGAEVGTGWPPGPSQTGLDVQSLPCSERGKGQVLGTPQPGRNTPPLPKLLGQAQACRGRGGGGFISSPPAPCLPIPIPQVPRSSSTGPAAQAGSHAGAATACAGLKYQVLAPRRPDTGRTLTPAARLQTHTWRLHCAFNLRSQGTGAAAGQGWEGPGACTE